jgi:hypothetical protein
MSLLAAPMFVRSCEVPGFVVLEHHPPLMYVRACAFFGSLESHRYRALSLSF